MVLDGFADCCCCLFFYSMFSLVLVFVSMFSSFGFFVSMFDCFMARSMWSDKGMDTGIYWNGNQATRGPCIGACNVAPL